MNNLIIEKDNELIKQRNFYEDKLEKMINDHQISKDDIINSYEKKINDFTINCNKYEEKLEALTQEKDYRLHKFQEKSSKDESYYNNIINSLKMQLEDFKERNRTIDLLEDEVNSLKQVLEKYKHDNKYQFSEIKFLENENKILVKQNEELKFENNRIEKLLYPYRRSNY